MEYFIIDKKTLAYSLVDGEPYFLSYIVYSLLVAKPTQGPSTDTLFQSLLLLLANFNSDCRRLYNWQYRITMCAVARVVDILALSGSFPDPIYNIQIFSIRGVGKGGGRTTVAEFLVILTCRTYCKLNLALTGSVLNGPQIQLLK